MFKKTLLAAATAGIVSVAALGMTATTASAAPGKPWQNGRHMPPPGPGGPYGQGGPYGSGGGYGYGNNGWYFNFGYQQPRPKTVVQKVCTPTYKTVPVWNRYQGWVWQTVYNGQTCQYVTVNPHHNW